MGYLDDHKKSGFKVGDTVKITRKAQSNENGWGSVWNDSMDYLVGLEVKINYDNGDTWGFQIKTTNGIAWNVPWFVLERVEKDKSADILNIGDKVEIIATDKDLDDNFLTRGIIERNFPDRIGIILRIDVTGPSRTIRNSPFCKIGNGSGNTIRISAKHLRKIESNPTEGVSIKPQDEPIPSPKARDCSTCIDNSSSALEGRCGDCYGDHSNYIEG